MEEGSAACQALKKGEHSENVDVYRETYVHSIISDASLESCEQFVPCWSSFSSENVIKQERHAKVAAGLSDPVTGALTSDLSLYVSTLLPGWEPAAEDPALPVALFQVPEPPAHTLTTQLPCLRYKTELCSRYTENGTCSYDDRCQFAHGLHELRVPSQHPKYKTELCRSFHSLGFCPYGLRCLFIHNPDERRPPRPIRPPNAGNWRRGGLCRMFQSQGGCPYGNRCHFSHVVEELSSEAPAKPRKTLCRTFEALGVCPYGSRCHFRHKMLSSEQAELTSPYLQLFQIPADGSLSPTSDEVSSSLGTPELVGGGSASPVLNELSANNAFAFSSLLLPLALRLQGLHCSQESDMAAIWGEPDFGLHQGNLSVKH